MITAEEAKRIANDARLKEQNEAVANADHYLSTLYEVIKDVANRGQYFKTISLGSEISEGVYLMANGNDVIPISLEYLKKELNDKGFYAKIFRGFHTFRNYMTISWGE